MPSPWDLLIPAAVALVILLAGWRPWSSRADGRWAGPVAIAAAVLTAFLLNLQDIRKLPAFPPTDASGGVFYVASLGAGIALICTLVPMPAMLRTLIILGCVVAAPAVVLRTRLADPSTRSAAAIWLVSSSLVTSVFCIFMDRRDSRAASGITGMLGMTLLPVFLSAVLLMSHSIVYYQVAAAIGGAGLAITALAIFCRRFNAAGISLVIGVTLSALVSAGFYFSDLSLVAALLSATGAVFFAVLSSELRGRVSNGWFALICLAGLLVPLGVAVAMMTPQFISETRETLAY